MDDNFYDGHNHLVDVETRAVAKDAARQSESNDSRLDKLEFQVKNLSVINEALYEIVAIKLNLSPNELTEMIEQVAVNRAAREQAKSTCRNCGRLVPVSRQKCMYCSGNFLYEFKPSPFDQHS